MTALYALRRAARNTLISARDVIQGTNVTSFRKAMENIPLMLAEKTYNASHPDYHPDMVRNYPGRIFNADKPCANPLYTEIKGLAIGSRVPRLAWKPVLKKAMAEASTVPGFDQVMERKAYIENYLADLGRTYGGHYVAGWVNLADAQFLYWAVRHFKPKTIVQTGVSNGLSSAFMMLALAKNGDGGTLHVIDIPAIFNPNDPAWKSKDTVYGVVIPEGKSSGWMVPDRYRDRFEVQIGDAKELLPPLVDRLDSIDMFFHDSDHSYNHMMFEYGQVMRKLTPGGLILADDIGWNSSLWDFADAHGIPSFNYRGTIGAAFFSG